MKHLQALREARGWTRAELARRANLNASTVGLLESGRIRPYDVQTDKLAAALGLAAAQAETLFDEADASTPAPRTATACRPRAQGK